MNNATKMALGFLMMVVGVYWYIGNVPFFGSALWKSLKIVFEGVFGVMLFFMGLIIAWIGWDDYKTNKLIKEEEEKAEKKRSKRK